jgi:hypothetical protein
MVVYPASSRDVTGAGRKSSMVNQSRLSGPLGTDDVANQLFFEVNLGFHSDSDPLFANHSADGHCGYIEHLADIAQGHMKYMADEKAL